MKKLFREIPRMVGENIILDKLTEADIPRLEKMVRDERVYRYLPTFLFERKYEDMSLMISALYSECIGSEGSLILGIRDKDNGRLCGLGEFYGFKDSLHKICIGYRLCPDCWGKGIATEAVSLMVEHLFTKKGIEIITASAMPENKASARVLEKNGFIRTAESVPEDWGYGQPTAADKWFR